MEAMKGEKARDFVLWLDDAAWLLPPKMSIEEARKLFERKITEEEELKHEQKK